MEHGKLADLRLVVNLDKGDTLQVFVGHYLEERFAFGPSGTIDRYDGFNLEEVRFCIF